MSSNFLKRACVPNTARLVVVLLASLVVVGCGTVPEEGTVNTRSAGVKPQRVRGKAAPPVGGEPSTTTDEKK
jgi:hypothetical protein